jgi:CRISPR system Cascade subunit CasA
VLFNLIDEKWIPVKRRDGTEEKIAPWQITEGFTDNPVVSLNSVRADFDGALIQFLIGLVQTVAAPLDEEEWEDFFASPPAPEVLRTRLMMVHHAFELGGDGPRFMQDLEKPDAKPKGIFSLLIDAPGDNAIDKNADHFVKRDAVTCLCPSCCPTALFTAQTNAPAGGLGYRTSLRGAGPLTTLVLGDGDHDTLWHLIWLNVLGEDTFLRTCANPGMTAEPAKFPWLGKTRTSEKDTGLRTMPGDVHPAQMFWGMPRRINLDLADMDPGVCELCGDTANAVVRTYREKNYGTNYEGSWLHPLSPYSQNKDGIHLPAHAQPGGMHFRHWLGLVQEDVVNKRQPALVVHEFRENRRQDGTEQFRLWAFGYDMDNMKARCWYESFMPLPYVNPMFRQDYEDCVASLVMAANEIASNTRKAVKKAWLRRTGDVKGTATISPIDSMCWHHKEGALYQPLRELGACM